jgi:eukaryotic-like serine/threonine-protein kinase
VTLALREGEVIADKYRLTRILGQGGMGAVAHATHEALSLEVAIKFLTMVHSDAARSRFAREGRAAAKLQGRHSTKVFDIGALPDGTPYMVMEYLRGSDFSNILETRGPLPIGELMEYMLQVCEGLGEAHAAGIVHRDIKPANLFLCHETDGRPLVKILDFGISKIDGGTQDLSLTSTQAVLGSPLYMSPEQLRASRSVDARSDIWSLGVVMYEMLTGKVPFDGSAITELTIRVVQDPPPPIVSARADLPPELAAVIHRCLEKDPAARYQTAFDLAVAIEPFAKLTALGSRSARVMRPSNSAASGVNSLSGSSPAWGNTQSAPVTLPTQTTRANLPRWIWAAPVLGILGALAVVWFVRKPSVGHPSEPFPLPSTRIELPALRDSGSTTPLPPSTVLDAPTGATALPTERNPVPPPPVQTGSRTPTGGPSRPRGNPTLRNDGLPSDRK